MPSDQVHRYDVFLSHSSADNPAVEAIAERLRAEGIEVFLDKWHLIPGNPWQEALEEALEASATCAVFIGPGGISPWQNEEMRAALENGVEDRSARVIPVLLPGGSKPDKKKLPAFLRRRTWVDASGRVGEEALRQLVAGIRGVAAEQLRMKTPARLWNVPVPRNQFFTGRDTVIENLHEALHDEGQAALGQAISGLGGIGKTQTAVEYCYRYRDEYQAVLWARAETESELVQGLVEIARVLELPEKNAQEQDQAVQAVKRWLGENDAWLLVLDNADTPEMLKPFLPTSPGGHVLLTSRADNFDVLEVAPLKLEVLPAEDARTLLLKRTRREDPSAAELKAAEELAEKLGYLPLTLEQAAAYIRKHASRFDAYLASYRRRRLNLLSKGSVRDYREPVATTWSLNFDQVAAASEAAAEILRLSVLLSPDQIPMELLIKGAAELGSVLSEALQGAAEDPLLLDELLQPLSQYSLIERNPEIGTFSVHRMVQEVVKQSLGEARRRRVTVRIVGALVQAYPGPEFSAWPLCDRLVPHWREVCEAVAQEEVISEAAGMLLSQAGLYAYERGRYAEATPLAERSLEILEKVLAEDHPSVAASLNNLALLHHVQGDYATAAPLFERSLQIRKKVLGEEHPIVAQSLNNLASLHVARGDYAKAAPLFERSLQIREEVLGEEHPLVATGLGNLARVHQARGEYAKAAPLFERALKIFESVFGEKHPDIATALGYLALLHQDQGEYAKAAPLFERSLQIREKALGEEHPHVATSLNNLATLHQDQGEYAKAVLLFERSLQIREKVLGGEHPEVAQSLNNLGVLYDDRGEYAKAMPLLERSLQIRETVLGERHHLVAQSLNNLATLLKARGEYAKAVPLFERGLEIYEKALGEEHPEVAASLNNLALLHQARGEYEKAAPLFERSLQIREKVLDNEHPDIATSLNNLALLHQARGEYEKAAPLLERSLQIREEVLGEKHNLVAQSLNNLASLHLYQREYAKAAPLFERSVRVYEKVLGEDHPDVAISLSNLAMAHQAQGEYEKATPLFERSLQILEKVLGEKHPHVATSLNNLALLYEVRGEYAKAAPLFERAIKIREAVLGEDHPLVATVRENYLNLRKVIADHENGTSTSAGGC
ncbi:MAG: tetratricopeptide repeat protein [bacterium]|nr:tetratricopeptide repeat protein [bacterium]